MRGKKSHATKKREQLIAEGKLPPERKDPIKQISAIKAAMAKLGPSYSPKILGRQDVRIIGTIRAECASLAREGLPAMREMLHDPKQPGSTRIAAWRALAEAGGIIGPKRDDKDGLDVPLNEMSAEEMAQATADLLAAMQAELATRQRTSGAPLQATDAQALLLDQASSNRDSEGDGADLVPLEPDAP